MTNQRIYEDNSFITPGPGERSASVPIDALWTVDEVASFLKLQPETIRSMARRGELPAIKLGKVWRFNKTAIGEMLTNVFVTPRS